MDNLDYNTCQICGIECNLSSQICGSCARKGSSLSNNYTIKDSWYNYVLFLNSTSKTDVKNIKNNEQNVNFILLLIDELVSTKITVFTFYKVLYENNYISYMNISPEYRWNFD